MMTMVMRVGVGWCKLGRPVVERISVQPKLGRPVVTRSLDDQLLHASGVDQHQELFCSVISIGSCCRG